MKVKELVEQLTKMNQEAEITVNTYAGCHGLEDTFEISGTDEFPADEIWKTPASAFIEVGIGCFCDGHRGSKIKKLGLGPQNISQYYLGLDAAFKKLEYQFNWYRKELDRLGKGQNYEEHLEIQRYSQAKRALENALRDIGKMQAHGKKETP